MNEKLKLESLVVELTSKCNLNCPHCALYEVDENPSQFNGFIDKQTIDKMLDEIEDVDCINVTGGEPLLNIPMFEYLVDKVIEKDFNVIYFHIVSNGTILDVRVADILNKIGVYCHSKYLKLVNKTSYELKLNNATKRAFNLKVEDMLHDKKRTNMVISTSYHDNKPHQALDFYDSLLDKSYADVKLQDEWESRKVLDYQGRAKSVKGVKYNITAPFYRLEYNEEKAIKNSIRLCYSGDILIGSVLSPYSKRQEYSIGNIHDMSFKEIVERNQFNHLLTRSEAFEKAEYEMLIETGAVKGEDKSLCVGMIEKMRIIEESRIALRKLHPDMSFDEIDKYADEGFKLAMKKIIDNKLTLDDLKNGRY